MSWDEGSEFSRAVAFSGGRCEVGKQIRSSSEVMVPRLPSHAVGQRAVEVLGLSRRSVSFDQV